MSAWILDSHDAITISTPPRGIRPRAMNLTADNENLARYDREFVTFMLRHVLCRVLFRQITTHISEINSRLLFARTVAHESVRTIVGNFYERVWNVKIFR